MQPEKSSPGLSFSKADKGEQFFEECFGGRKLTDPFFQGREPVSKFPGRVGPIKPTSENPKQRRSFAPWLKTTQLP